MGSWCWRVRGGAIPRLITRQEQPFEDSVSSFAAEKVDFEVGANEIVCVVGETLSATFVAYGFARYRFPGRDKTFQRWELRREFVPA